MLPASVLGANIHPGAMISMPLKYSISNDDAGQATYGQGFKSLLLSFSTGKQGWPCVCEDQMFWEGLPLPFPPSPHAFSAGVISASLTFQGSIPMLGGCQRTCLKCKVQAFWQRHDVQPFSMSCKHLDLGLRNSEHLCGPGLVDIARAACAPYRATRLATGFSNASSAWLCCT